MTRLVHLTTADISLELLLGPQLEAFAAAGYEVIGMSAPGPFVEQIERRGIRHFPVRNATRSMALGKDLLAVEELRRTFRELQPDIVHTHNPKPGVYGRIAARLAGVPVVVNTVHGLYALPDDPLAKQAVVYGLERIAATCSDAELVQNVEDLAVLRRRALISASKLTLLGNGIDLTRFRAADDTARWRLRSEWGVDDSTVVVGAVGRLVLEKGYGELFAAWEEVHRSGSDVALVVAGPVEPDKADALPSDLIARAEASGVRLLGMRSDVEDLYHAMDLYVLASHREGFPRSAMEAAASGLPVIATDIRGCRQVVDDGTTGRLVPVRSPEALAAAIIELASDPDLRSAMAAAAADKAAREFDQQRVIDISLQTYDRLLRARGVTPP